jgi:hypothetical protein
MVHEGRYVKKTVKKMEKSKSTTENLTVGSYALSSGSHMCFPTPKSRFELLSNFAHEFNSTRDALESHTY